MSTEDVTEVRFCKMINCENWSKHCRGHCTYKVITINEDAMCDGYRLRDGA